MMIAILLTAALFAQAGPATSETRIRAWIAEYADALNRHDVDAAMRFYADDIVFLREGKPTGRTLAFMRDIREWERAMRTRWEYRIRSVSGDAAVLELQESNDLYTALGAKRPVVVELRFRDGRIYHSDLVSVTEAGKPYREGLRALESWLAAKPASETAGLLENGRLRFTGEAGAKLAPLLKEWRKLQSDSRKQP